VLSCIRPTRSKVNVLEVFVSVPAVRVFSGSALTICFDLASRDDTSDGSAFYELFHKVSGLSLGLTFRVWVSASV